MKKIISIMTAVLMLIADIAGIVPILEVSAYDEQTAALVNHLESTGGTVYFSYSDLDLKKDDVFLLHITGDSGDVVKISLYYTDENGNQKTVTFGGLEGATLSANGNLTEGYIVPCNVDYLYGQVIYEKSKPELSYELVKISVEEPEETTTQVATTETTTQVATTETTATTTAMMTTTEATTTTTSTMMTIASTRATTTTSTMTTASRPTLQITETKVILQPGDQYQIQANQTGLRYRTSSEEVAIVSKSGVITAMNPGTARITVYNADYDAVVVQVTVTDEVQAVLRGDANSDGEVNISDVVLMNRVYVGVDRISKQGLANVDTDGDGKITLTDSMNVLRYLVHLIDEL
ncbi:MAG: dockerin type I repeat-containing protein [Oscillospiraceae bacterium]|nr:dockerin type I repeat-containing protein [Oscillospiraceae bacterium]